MAFGAWLAELARQYPDVREFVVGNEPNQPAFWRPQFAGTRQVSAATFGHFLAVNVANDVSLDYADAPSGQEIRPQHYAFLVSEDEFDSIYAKIRDRGIQHWADPRQSRPCEINHNDGGLGVYFLDPAGHYLEIITQPYGSGG